MESNTEFVTFEIFRYDASRKSEPRFQSFEIAPEPGMSVLDALFKIQDELDPSLAFRYSCRGAVCGSCAMVINGRFDLACRVKIERLGSRRIVLEPLPNFEVIHDLVVDMEPFWKKYRKVQPYLQEKVQAGEKLRMPPEERQEIDQYVNCILCALCYASCPVLRSNENFTGPAALAKLYRFLADPRDGRDSQVLEQENSHQGAWGCHTITRCIEACPKNVRPTDGIEAVRRKLIVHKFKKLLGKKQ